MFSMMRSVSIYLPTIFAAVYGVSIQLTNDHESDVVPMNPNDAFSCREYNADMMCSFDDQGIVPFCYSEFAANTFGQIPLSIICNLRDTENDNISGRYLLIFSIRN